MVFTTRYTNESFQALDHCRYIAFIELTKNQPIAVYDIINDLIGTTDELKKDVRALIEANEINLCHK